MFRHPSFPTHPKLRISKFAKIVLFEHGLPTVLDLLGYPGVSKDKENWFWEEGTGRKVPKSKKGGVSGSPISKSKELAVGFWLSASGCGILAVESRLWAPGCRPLAVISWL